VSLTLSQTGMTLGTPAYMAPEQADPQARSPVDCRADLYSLAVVAYQMLTGRVPFQGTTPLTVAMGHLLEPPPPPQDLNPDLPEGVAAALVRGLAKKPEDRFERASALVEAIEAGAVPAPVEEVAPSPAPPPLQEPKAIPAEAAIALATRQPPQTVPQAAIAARKVRAQRRGVPLWAWVVGGLAAVALVVWMVTALGGGGSGPTPGPLPTIRETAAEVTNTARPTETPTLWPTNTPWPTNTASLPAVIPEADATPETTATESPPASETTIWHTVQRGETMSSIAQKYATTWQAIVEANGLTSPNQIYVGMKLKIPATGGTPSVCRHYHTIQPGEWIWQIARNYGVDPYDLMAVNGLTLQTADPPSVGQVLCIP
jgi:LysM repeat protein